MKKFILLCCLALCFEQPLLAHKEWVHQYLVQEAYKFLEAEIGTVPCLKSQCGIDYNGPGDNFYGYGVNDHYWYSNLPQVAMGSWREDLEDPVWLYNDLFNGANASSSHFWVADNGDNYQTQLTVLAVTYTVHNAWEKANAYLFNGSQSEDIIISEGGTTVDHNGQPVNYVSYMIKYNTIFDLYAGYYEITRYVDNLGNTITLPSL